MSIYPNPATTQMNVRLNATENFDAQLSVKNILGQEVYNDMVNVKAGKNNIDINVADLQSGIYLVNLKSGKSTITKKVMVK